MKEYSRKPDATKDTSGGRNIYFVEVENALAAHPAVAEIAIVSRKHPDMARPSSRSSTPSPGRSYRSTHCVNSVRNASADKLPRELVLCDIPRNPPGRSSSTSCAPTSKTRFGLEGAVPAADVRG